VACRHFVVVTIHGYPVHSLRALRLTFLELSSSKMGTLSQLEVFWAMTPYK